MTTGTRPAAVALLARAVRSALGETIATVDGMGGDELHAVAHPRANTPGWIAWHVFRTADVIGSRVGDAPELWAMRGYAAAWGLPREGNGSGQPTADAQALRLPSAEALALYGRELRDELSETVGALDGRGLDRRVSAFSGRDFSAADALHIFVVLHTVRHQGELNLTRTLLELGTPGGGA
ncbi:MAG: DinB family protein [Chloroflexi bacterium]|nr:DinB family protein [Chloroflexota bacterium]